MSLDSDITLTFDSPVKTSTLNASNIVITGINTGIISGTFSGGGTTSVVFNPTTDFKPGEVITVTLTSALENTSGGPLSPPQTFSFTTRNAATPSPVFTAADIDTSADGARSVFAADMDGDGDLDIISASLLDDTIAWYENDGNADPTFTATDIATSADGAYSVFAADMDGDGDYGYSFCFFIMMTPLLGMRTMVMQTLPLQQLILLHRLMEPICFCGRYGWGR